MYDNLIELFPQKAAESELELRLKPARRPTKKSYLDLLSKAGKLYNRKLTLAERIEAMRIYEDLCKDLGLPPEYYK